MSAPYFYLLVGSLYLIRTSPRIRSGELAQKPAPPRAPLWQGILPCLFGC